MKIIAALFLAAFLQASEDTLTEKFADAANDAVEALDRESHTHLESRRAFVDAKQEAEKYMQKAGRYRKTKADAKASLALLTYSIQIDLCQAIAEGQNETKKFKACLDDESQKRREAYAALNRNP
jgi:hypothetical protein